MSVGIIVAKFRTQTIPNRIRFKSAKGFGATYWLWLEAEVDRDTYLRPTG